MDTPGPASARLDLRAIFTSMAPLVWYVGLVLLATLGGYPGAVCTTPMAWLLGLWAGQHVVAVTTSPPPRRPILEAAIAGALIGLIEGALFALLATRIPLQDTQELWQMLGFTACIVLLGIPVTAGLAALTASLALRRRGLNHLQR